METRDRYVRLLSYEEATKLIDFVRKTGTNNDGWIVPHGVHIMVSDASWNLVLEFLNTNVSRYEITDRHPSKVHEAIVTDIKKQVAAAKPTITGFAGADSERFPNGFDSWQETHFEIVQAITIEHIKDEPTGAVERAHEESGHGGLYELAKELTDEFERKYEGTIWGEGMEYFDKIEEFVENKLK